MQNSNHRSPRAIVGSALVFLVVFFFTVHYFRSFSLETRSDFNTSRTEYGVVDSDEGGPRVRQATTVLHDDYEPVFERAVKSHIRHGEAWGYPTHVLRHSMLNGNSGFSYYNKIAFLQMLLLNEMAKPYGQRAGWIVSVCP